MLLDAPYPGNRGLRLQCDGGKEIEFLRQPFEYDKLKMLTKVGEMAEWFKAHAWKACVL